MQISVKEGMVLMDQSQARLLQAKSISYETAISRAENKKLIPKPA